VALVESSVIPEFAMHEYGLDSSEIEELEKSLATATRTGKDRFMAFTDILVEYVKNSEWTEKSPSFMTMCAKASFLRGLYSYNQVLAKGTSNIACKGYAAAAYCKQSLDPRWMNNLRNYVNQAWQARDHIVFAELSGLLASILMDLGYADRAKTVAFDSIEKVTMTTSKNEEIRNRVQAALLRQRIMLASISRESEPREEVLIRLDAAEEAAKHLDHQLALTDISYQRARVMEEVKEYEKAMGQAVSALRKYERMGYLQGVADARNVRGVIFLNRGELQDARDQFEEVLGIQQRLNNQIGVANAFINVGEIDRVLEQFDQMETYNRKALEISQEAEYMRGIATSKINLGDVALRRGGIDEAIELYEEAISWAESSGMKDLLCFVLFLAGDAHFLKREFDRALELYRKAKEFSTETGHSEHSFIADVSELVTTWAKEEEPRSELLESVKSIVGPTSKWLEIKNASMMRDLYQIVVEDPSVESELCVFFDGEMNFQCRVERNSLKKECFGNLFWMGDLCKHFKDFLESLDS
jgi:tetratricopeptide (TPR) repeat protein